MKFLISSKKVLTLTGIEPGSPSVLVCSANHSATRIIIFSNKFVYLYFNRFEFKEFAFGNYLTSINGLREGLSDYWAVHVLPSDKTTILKERSDALKEYQLTTGKFLIKLATF